MGNPHRDKQRRQRRGKDFDNERFSDLDVSVRNEPVRHERDDRPPPPDRPPRPKLEFREVMALGQGDCRCKVTMAEGMRGRIYNFTVERMGRDRPSRFFRDSDAGDLASLIIRAGKWIESERSTE